MIFVHCSKSAHAIGQNQSRVFWLPGNNESFECVIENNAQGFHFQILNFHPKKPKSIN